MTLRRPPALRSAAALLAALLAAGCSSWNTDGDVFGMLSPYRVDIQQGNVVTQDQIERIKPGMHRLQVRDVLGTPLLTDAFHADRWDYVFTLRQPGRPLQRRSVVLVFDGDVLKTVTAPELPTEREFIDSIARAERTLAAQALELTPEQIQALPPPAPPASAPAAEAPPSVAPRQYPPLEPT